VHRVAAYLSKYLTEESICDLPTGTRRFSASRGLVLFDRSEGTNTWILVKLPIEQLRGRSDGIAGEQYEADEGGAPSLISFVAEHVDPAIVFRLCDGGGPLAIEVQSRRSRD
jgi:hypothetical protein